MDSKGRVHEGSDHDCDSHSPKYTFVQRPLLVRVIILKRDETGLEECLEVADKKHGLREDVWLANKVMGEVAGLAVDEATEAAVPIPLHRQAAPRARAGQAAVVLPSGEAQTLESVSRELS